MKKMRKLVSLLLAGALLATGCAPAPASKAAALFAKPGTYTAAAPGYHGDLKLEVAYEAAGIKSIKVVQTGETPDIGGKAIEKLTKEVIEKKTLAVDAVAGATLTSKAFLKALEDTATQAGGDMAKLKAKPAAGSTAAKPAVAKSADVVVLGGGGAGLSAAVAAAQGGAKVILIEKTMALGGNTLRAGGPYNAVDPDRQKSVAAANEAAMASVKALSEKPAKNPEHQKWMDQLKKDLTDYQASGSKTLFDSMALHVLQTWDGGDYEAKLPFVEKLVHESLPTAKWLEQNGLKWRDSITTVPGGLWPRAHIPENAAGGDYIKTNEALAKKLGVEIILECAAKELVQKDGRVTGVKAQMADGTPVELTAAKGVVIATGGFAASKEMRQKYDPSLGPQLGTTNTPANVGEGILIAEKLGAKTVGMEYIQSLPLGDPQTGALNGWVGGEGVEFYYQVNSAGKRFMAEDGRRDVMTKALLAQTGSMSYIITDSVPEVDDGVTLWGDKLEDLIKAKKVFKADTIEDLAKQIGVDPAALKATNDAFNASVDSGKDAEFGRKLFKNKIDKAPFYASPRMPTVHHTMGGLEIDLTCHVLDKDGKPIPGLFAAGEVTGGIHGKNRLGGNALVDIHVFGRIAGETAAKGA